MGGANLFQKNMQISFMFARGSWREFVPRNFPAMWETGNSELEYDIFLLCKIVYVPRYWPSWAQTADASASLEKQTFSSKNGTDKLWINYELMLKDEYTAEL